MDEQQTTLSWEPRFCANCGAPAEGVNFCARCGFAVRGPSESARVAPPPPPPHPPPKAPVRRRWWIVAVVWIALLLIGAVAGFAFGFLSGPGPSLALPSEDQQAVLDEYGEPPAFALADGPLGPGEDSARLEQWLYSDAGLIVVFVDGRRVSDEEFTPEIEYPERPCGPTDFTRSMRADDVARLLGEDGVRVPDVTTAFDDYEAFAYEESGVVVGYLDGWVYTVQTY